LGGGGLLILIVLWFLGADPMQLLMLAGGGAGAPPTGGSASGPPPEDDTSAQFVSAVLADTEDTWKALFGAGGSTYPEPQLVLYTDSVRSACGFNSAATGPFYCPGDRKIYLDLGFLRELERLGAPGDFAFAYVVAHEVGHHVQNVTGTEQQVRQRQARSSQQDANALSVLMELQADCYAGLWAHHAERTRDVLEAGDLEEGLRAAAAIGDDRLQKNAGQRVQPESFTHGSSEQRVRWFRAGFESGSVSACDTLSAAGLR
jgi:predicted metalloprotease